MDISAAIEKAKKGAVLPVYVIGGEERLLMTRLCEAVRVATVGGGPRGLAEDLFDGQGTTAGTVITACRTLPMMAKRRLVTVRGFDAMASNEQEGLVPYLSNPEPSTVLLLVANKLDKRKKLALEANKAKCLFVADHLKDDAASRWIEHEASVRGVKMDRGAVESLTLAIGGDLGQLSDAIERLALYTNNGEVTARTVDVVVTPVREVPAFDLANAVAERRKSDALALITRLLEQGQDPLAIMGMLNWQFAALARARQFAHRPVPGVTPAQAIKVPPFRVAAVQELASKWSLAQLARALRVLAATDAALKGGRKINEKGRRLVAVEAVLALCGAPGLGELAG